MKWKIQPACEGFRAPLEGGAKDLMIVDDNDMCIGIIWDYIDNNKSAKLIAAAPEMAEALQTIALHCQSLDVQGIRDICDAALAKAGLV